MARLRLRCSQCQQFFKGKCQLGFPDCRGADSIAADECPCFMPPGGQPAFLIDENEQKQLALF